MSMATGSRLGVYEIVSRLGAGGMGEVYRARDPKLGREVAIKVLPASVAADPDRLARFEREAQLLASLNHPNIAQIYGLEGQDRTPFIVMELVDGETLDARLKGSRSMPLERERQGAPEREGFSRALPIPEVLAIARQLADALDAAHERGIVHRDLKPANIVITPEGVVKVLDFGLAKGTDGTGRAGGSRGAGGSDAGLTHSPTVMAPTLDGVLLGTAPYMSPEQARGKAVDKRSDVWAFGCVLFEMLTGRRAFSGETTTDSIAAILEREPDWAALPPSTPSHIARLLRRCLEKDLKRRLRDIGDVRIELDVADVAGSTLPPRSQPTAMRFAVPALAIALLGTLAALAVLSTRPPAVPQRAVQFAVAPPDSTTLEALAPVPSPDGARIAFVARGASGRTAIWIRDVSSTVARQVPETEDVSTWPFWSPDGRWLGFFAQGKVKKVSLSGGPALTICAIENLLGATWNRDNIIVLAPVNRTVLHKVSAAGGVPEPITTLNADRKENSHRSPQFLPDGRHFLFTARSDVIENNLVYVGSLDSKDVKPLVAAQSNASYAAGYLLFAREGTLMAQRFDPTTLTLSGDAMVVAARIRHVTPSSAAAFGVSSDGAVLAYEPGVRAVSSLTWFDRAGAALGSISQENNFTDLRLSPDGRFAAVVVPDPDSGNRDIWLVDVRAGAMTRFTSNPANDWQVAWSPDSRRLAFASDRNGRSSVYLKAIDGGDEELLLRLPDRGVFPKSFSQDGSILTLAIDSPAGVSGIAAMRLTADRSPFSIGSGTTDRENDAALSPDGRWVAFDSRRAGVDDVYVAPFPKGGRHQVSVGGGSAPRWKRDGAELYYLSPDGAVVAVAIRGKDSIEPGTPVPLFKPCNGLRPEPGAFAYDVTPDGSRFLAICPSPASHPAAITVSLDWMATLK